MNPTYYARGPWSRKGRNKDEWYIGNTEQVPIFTVLCGTPNARETVNLIASAPTLLKALQDLLAFEQQDSSEAEDPEILAAEAAITQATGGPS